MPHIIVKMLSGRTDKQKQQLAKEITKVVMKVTGINEDADSVAIEDVEQRDWTENFTIRKWILLFRKKTWSI